MGHRSNGSNGLTRIFFENALSNIERTSQEKICPNPFNPSNPCPIPVKGNTIPSTQAPYQPTEQETYKPYSDKHKSWSHHPAIYF